MRTAKFILGAAIAMVFAAPQANGMSDYRWKYRPIVVFADQDSDEALTEQRRIFAGNSADLTERDIVVVWVVGNTVRTEFGPEPGLTAAQLRARLGASENKFRVVLIGKDGGSKLARSVPLNTSALFATIDEMPMRRGEIRRGN